MLVYKMETLLTPNLSISQWVPVSVIDSFHPKLGSRETELLDKTGVTKYDLELFLGSVTKNFKGSIFGL